MSSREIELTCPCCSARLVVDTRTSQVMKVVRKDEVEGAPSKDKWSSALDKVDQRSRSGLDKLESALEYERGKKDRFDDLFKKATEKHKDKREDDEV